MHSCVIMFCCLVQVTALFSSGFFLYFVLKIQVKSMFSSYVQTTAETIK